MKKIFTLFAALLCVGSMMADVTFTSGTVITFDATAYGSGMNIFIPGTASPACTSTEWWSSTSSVITFTLTSDWTVKTSTGLFKSSGSGWSTVSASTLPADATYTILTVNSDGKTYSWSAPTSDPKVTLSVSATKVEPGTEITLTAEASNFTGDVTYTYSYATDGENFTALGSNTHTPEAEGTYTYKVVATAGEQEASATKAVTVASVTYTVVGASTDLFGTAWAPALTANDMTKQVDGTYKWEKTGVVLAVGSYEYKIVEDHAWTNPNYPSEGNASFSISEAATYTVTITFNSSNKEYNATATKTGSGEKDTDCFVAGTFTSWSTNKIQMDMSEDKKIYTTTVNFAETGAQEFKIIEGTSWMGNTGTMTRENCSGWTMSSSVSGNCTLTVDMPGDYIFTYTIEDHKLSVTYPANSYTLAVTDAEWASLCLPFDATVPEGADAYRAESLYLSEGVEYIITLKSIDAIPAGEGVLVNASEGSYAFNRTDETPAAISNLLKGTTAEWTVEGTIYTLAYEWQGFPIFSQYTPETLAANKAYLPASAIGSPARVRFVIDNEQLPTSLKNAEESTEIKKALINGQIMILRGEKMFDVNGRQVK